MASKFVSHTSGTRTVDGTGQSSRMERGQSVCSNPAKEGSSTNTQKADPRAAGSGDLHAGISVRQTPFNQHGITGNVEPAGEQPKHSRA